MHSVFFSPLFLLFLSSSTHVHVSAPCFAGHLPAAVPAAVQYAAPPPSYASQPPPYAAAPSSYSLPPLTHQPYPAVPPQYSAAPSY